MPTTLYATFASIPQAEKAAGALLDHGVLPEDLSIVTPEPGTSPADMTHHQATAEDQAAGLSGPEADVRVAPTAAGRSAAAANVVQPADEEPLPSRTDMLYTRRPSGAGDNAPVETGITTTTPADAAAGAMKGAGFGLAAGILATLVSIAIPGIGLVVGGGALATALGGTIGATAAGAAAGGIYGYLRDQGMPEEAAIEYTRAWEGGGTVLAVNTPSGGVDRETVENLLAKYGASNFRVFGAAA